MRKIALVLALAGVFLMLRVNNALAIEEALIGTAKIYQERNGKNCNFFNSCVLAGEDLHIDLAGIAYSNGTPFPDGEKVTIYLDNSDSPLVCGTPAVYVEVQNNSVTAIISGDKIKSDCSYQLNVTLPDHDNGLESTKASRKTYTQSPVASIQCGDDENQCNEDLNSVYGYELCSQQIKEGTSQFEACQACFQSGGVWTAVGCIPSDPESVITTIVTIGLTAGGGIVLIMILVGSFMLSVSQGDPNKTKEAKEIITSAIIGLLFVIFSVTILQFIGVSILRIPGFGE